jgi:hypothetical protein
MTCLKLERRLLDFFGGIARSNAAEDVEDDDEYGDVGKEVNDDDYENDEGLY